MITFCFSLRDFFLLLVACRLSFTIKMIWSFAKYRVKISRKYVIEKLILAFFLKNPPEKFDWLRVVLRSDRSWRLGCGQILHQRSCSDTVCSRYSLYKFCWKKTDGFDLMHSINLISILHIVGKKCKIGSSRGNHWS